MDNGRGGGQPQRAHLGPRRVVPQHPQLLPERGRRGRHGAWLCSWLERVLQKCAVRHYGAAATAPPRVEAGLLLGLPGFSRRVGWICCALGDLQPRATATGVGGLALDRCSAAIRSPQRADRAVQMSSSPKPRLGAHPARSRLAAERGPGNQQPARPAIATVKVR